MLTDWEKRAACNGQDTELFFAATGKKLTKALAICARCPVKRPCLEGALTVEAERAGDPHGVRGGLPAKERAKLVRQRKAAMKQESLVLQRVRKLAAAGLDDIEIGRQLNRTQGSVGALRRRHGVPAGQHRGRKPQPVGGGGR